MYDAEHDNREEVKELNKLRRKANARMSIRYHAIILYLKGYSKKKIAEILGLSYYTIRNYAISYDSKGIEGLAMRKSTGARRKLTSEQEQELYDCIATKLPKDVGFSPFVNWTASLACKWVKDKFSVEVSERGMRAIFYRLSSTETRLGQLDGIIQTLYEDRVKGVVTDSMFKNLMSKYERERNDKSDMIQVLCEKVKTSEKQWCDIDSWLNLIRG